MDEATLKSKKVADLREIAKTFGLKGYEKMRKADLIAALMIDEEPAKEETEAKAAEPEAKAAEPAAEEKPAEKTKKRARSTSRLNTSITRSAAAKAPA